MRAVVSHNFLVRHQHVIMVEDVSLEDAVVTYVIRAVMLRVAIACGDECAKRTKKEDTI
jgi:hypothetical protein